LITILPYFETDKHYLIHQFGRRMGFVKYSPKACELQRTLENDAIATLSSMVFMTVDCREAVAFFTVDDCKSLVLSLQIMYPDWLQATK
jgi:hypothetical protein